MVFTPDSIYFLSSKNKIEVLKQLEGSKDKTDDEPTIHLIVRDRVCSANFECFGKQFYSYRNMAFSLQNDKDKENFKKLVDIIKESKNGKTLGVFPKDVFASEFYESWKAALKESQFENIDISAGVAYTIGPKEDSELAAIKKACNVTVDVFTKYLKENIMEIIDADKVSLIFVNNSICLFMKFEQLY